jgi:hypothetical protein
MTARDVHTRHNIIVQPPGFGPGTGEGGGPGGHGPDTLPPCPKGDPQTNFKEATARVPVITRKR